MIKTLAMILGWFCIFICVVSLVVGFLFRFLDAREGRLDPDLTARLIWREENSLYVVLFSAAAAVFGALSKILPGTRKKRPDAPKVP